MAQPVVEDNVVPLRTSSGWAPTPKALSDLRRQLKIDDGEFSLISYIQSRAYKWDSPTGTLQNYDILQALDIGRTTLRRRKTSLVAKGLLVATEMTNHRGHSTGVQWDLRPLWNRVAELSGKSMDQLMPGPTPVHARTEGGPLVDRGGSAGGPPSKIKKISKNSPEGKEKGSRPALGPTTPSTLGKIKPPTPPHCAAPSPSADAETDMAINRFDDPEAWEADQARKAANRAARKGQEEDFQPGIKYREVDVRDPQKANDNVEEGLKAHRKELSDKQKFLNLVNKPRKDSEKFSAPPKEQKIAAGPEVETLKNVWIDEMHGSFPGTPQEIGTSALVVLGKLVDKHGLEDASVAIKYLVRTWAKLWPKKYKKIGATPNFGIVTYLVPETIETAQKWAKWLPMMEARQAFITANPKAKMLPPDLQKQWAEAKKALETMGVL